MIQRPDIDELRNRIQRTIDACDCACITCETLMLATAKLHELKYEIIRMSVDPNG